MSEHRNAKTFGLPRLHPMTLLLLLSIAAGVFLALDMMSLGFELSSYHLLLAAFAFCGGNIATAWIIWPRRNSEAHHDR